ncbi:hypothetical protein EXIGLDRAFT_784744, partial [Exidia glandulosa HHB12029]
PACDAPKPRPRRVRGIDLESSHFVSFAQASLLPPGRDAFVVLADVIQDVTGQTHQLYVRDTDGRDVLLKFHLALEVNERWVQDEIPVGGGGMVCIRNPRIHRFLDGQVGLRIEDHDMATNFKYFAGCDIASFKRINEKLTQSLCEPKCEKCANPEARSLCSKCRCARYCTRDCQQQHWRIHKYVCNIVKTLREYEELFGTNPNPNIS